MRDKLDYVHVGTVQK